MSVTDPSSATDTEAYRSLVSAYVSLLQKSERWHPQVARPLVAYYTQSHVGQRVTQLNATIVRAAARGAPVAGWSGDDLDRRRKELELLAPTLDRRITIGRLIAAVPLGVLAAGAAANHVGWLNTHGVLISWLLVATVVASIAADAYATWCFSRKFEMFARGVRSRERRMFDQGILSEEPEPRIALHLWTLDIGAMALALVAFAIPYFGVAHSRSATSALGFPVTPGGAAGACVIVVFVWAAIAHGWPAIYWKWWGDEAT